MTSLMDANAAATTSKANESASAYIQDFLRQYNLESMTGWVEDELAKGYDDVVVMQHMRDQPEFQQRFKVIFDRQKAGLSAMSPAEVVDYESQVSQLMASAGFAKGFYDSPDDFYALMMADKSVDEVKQRVMGGFAKVQQAAKPIRDTFREWYGPDGDTALAMFFLDPDKTMPLLETQMAAAEVGGTANRFGIGMGRSLGEELARLGVTGQSSEQQFGQLAQGKGLFDENFGEKDNLSVDKEGVEAVFNIDQGAVKKVAKRSEERSAAFAGSGGTSVGQKGASGLGAAGKP